MAHRISEGQLATAIASMVVQVLRQYTGRGPTKSRTYFNEDLIVVVLQGTFTPAERSLVANGKGDVVLSGRRALQDIMRGDLIAGIEASRVAPCSRFLATTRSSRTSRSSRSCSPRKQRWPPGE